MNSGTSPTPPPSSRGWRALLAAPPNIPGSSRVPLLAGRPSACGEPAVSSTPSHFAAFPSPGPGMGSLAGGWCGEDTVWGADAEGGTCRRGVSSRGSPRQWQQLEVWR